MAKLNITQAAKAAGIGRATLYRHIKEGKVSCEENAKGERVIDTSELIRAYGGLQSVETGDTVSRGVPMKQSETALEQVLRRQISSLETHLEDSKRREEKLWHEIEVKNRLLTDGKPEKTGFWGRVFGR